jgi:hypothetical protein
MLTRLWLIRLLCIGIALGCGLPSAASAEPARGFAVLELFTSEGCSSCPPADEAFSTVARDAAGSALPFYVLEWHVDYWDYLGWKDPFGTRYASQRQETYAGTLPSSVYTPQAVINGVVVAEPASDTSGVETAARRVLRSAPVAPITLDIRPELSGRSLKVRVSVQGTSPGSVLVLAVVESGLGRTPNAGENAGRKLTHSNVVRAVKEVAAATGDAVLELPPDLDLRNSAVIGLVQDRATMRIDAAARVPLGDRTAGRITGHAFDVRGNGIPGIEVQACSTDMCIPAVTDRMGSFRMDNVPPGTYAVTIGTSTPPATVTVAAGMTLTLPPLVVAGNGHL